jgi:predicted nuclease of predicted toxin-antitoxin system
LRFLVDAQLPPKLAKSLVLLGHEAKHVIDIGMASASDEALWRHAVATGSVVITKDGDFAVRRQSMRDGPKIVWIRFGNTTSVALHSKLTPVVSEIVNALEAGETLIEVR